MSINFPISYDTKSGTFEDPNAWIKLTLNGGINDSVTTITLNEVAAADALNIPGYLTFQKDVVGAFEIVKYTARPVSGQLTVTRGALGSTAQAHDTAEQLIQDPVSAHFALVREMLLAVEKFQGLVGLKANLPVTCEPPECYIATDTGEIFYCVITNTWRLINRLDHGSHTGLDADDHTQYHTEARKITWHTALDGEHLTNPTTHTHNGVAGQGNPIARWLQGLSGDKPANPTVDCQLYYETDTGLLFFGVSGAWCEYSIMPTGVGVLFEDSCPPGWTREAALDDKFLRGAPAGVYSIFSHGGSVSHAHTMPDVIAHTHDIPEMAASSDHLGGHDHNWSEYDGAGGSTVMSWGGTTASSYVATSDNGAHNHSFTLPAQNTQSTGSNPANSASADNLPSYKKLVFCTKDA